MYQKVVNLLDKLTREELLLIKEVVELKIKDKFKEELAKRVSKRVNVNISASMIIEREKEFFFKEHKITIVEMSTHGLVFRASTIVYENDLFNIAFRSPSSRVTKEIDCAVVRIKKLVGENKFQVAAKSVDKTELKEYRNRLKRGFN